MIEDLALIAHPHPRPGEVDPPELFDDAAEQIAEQRREYAENLRAMCDDLGEDPLLAELRATAGRQRSAEAHQRALLAYGRHFTGSPARPGYSWPMLAEAAGLDRKTAERRVNADDVAAVRDVVGNRAPWNRGDGWAGLGWLNPSHTASADDRTPVLLSPEEIVLLRELLAAEHDRLDSEPPQSPRSNRLAMVIGLDADLEYAGMDPDEADERLSREATWHPANQRSRMLPVVLKLFSRWSGGKSFVTNAIRYAAGVEYDRRGWDGVREVATAAHQAADRSVG